MNYCKLVITSSLILYYYIFFSEEYEEQIRKIIKEEIDLHKQITDPNIQVELENKESIIENNVNTFHQFLSNIEENDSFISQIILSLENILVILLNKYENQISFLQSNKFSINNDAIIERVSVLSILRLMCISKSLCLRFIPYFLRLLNSSLSNDIKTQICFTIEDCVIRFPNIMDHLRPDLFKLLSSSDFVVKKTVLLVISGLILSDSERLKGEDRKSVV